MIVGLTGNIGSGKTKASKFFEKAGFKVINVDILGHNLYKKKAIKGAVVRQFGDKILTNGEIDRKKLKNIVFYDPEELIALNKIIHPLIVEEVKTLIKKSKNKNIVIEAALIIEFNFRDYDHLILLRIDRDVQLQRLLDKGKYTEEEINNILDSQMPQENKIKFADFIIDNSGTKEEFESNVTKIIKELES